MTEAPLSVKELIEALDLHLQFGYQNVTVEGEVTGFRATRATYQFSLSEAEANLRTVVFKNRLQQPLEDGMKVRVTGTPRLHPQWGFSFNGLSVELAGEGELRRAFELLKQKLEAEGLFEPVRRRPLPSFPHAIGLITSKEGAVLHDFMRIVNAKWGGLKIQFVPVAVQGTQAVDEIVGALRQLNQQSTPPDVLVLIRGGGSLEDLVAFNSEAVAREVAASRQPIVVGVGHEPDVSLADLAADVRAATPTQAADLVVPSRDELGRELSEWRYRLNQGVARLVIDSNRRLQTLAGALEAMLKLPAERLSRLESRLRQGLTRLDSKASRHAQALAALARLLKGANPENLLSRGYSITYLDSSPLKDSASVRPGDRLVVQLHKGKLGAEVRE